MAWAALRVAVYQQTDNVCPYDAVKVAGSLKHGNEWVEVWTGDALVASLSYPDIEISNAFLDDLPLAAKEQSNDDTSNETNATVLRCAAETAGEDCDVQIKGALVVNASTILLSFDTATTMPMVTNWSRLLDLSVASDAVGEWVSADQLVLHVAETQLATALNGSVVDLTKVPRWRLRAQEVLTEFYRLEKLPLFSVEQVLRFAIPGPRRVVLCRREIGLDVLPGRPCGSSAGMVVESTTLEVASCTAAAKGWRPMQGNGNSDAEGKGEEEKNVGMMLVTEQEELQGVDGESASWPLVARVRSSSSSSSGGGSGGIGVAREVVEPVVRVDAVVPMQGGVRLPANVLPPAANGEGDEEGWGVCGWLWLEREAVDGHETVFFKGSGYDQHRTPSVWLSPLSSTPLLRCSEQEGEWDIGATATASLPLQRWTHVCMMLTNHTISSLQSHESEHVEVNKGEGGEKEVLQSSTPQTQFEFRWIVDGVEETGLGFTKPIAANSGPLFVGKDPTFGGIHGYMAELQVFGESLNATQLQAVYTRSMPFFDAVDENRWTSRARLLPRGTERAALLAESLLLARDMNNGENEVRLGMTHGEMVEVAGLASARGKLKDVEEDMRGEARNLESSTGVVSIVRESDQSAVAQRAIEMLEDCDVDIEVPQEMLVDACDDGRGDETACEAVVKLLLQPGRLECGREVARIGVGSLRDVGRARRILERMASRGNCNAFTQLAWLTPYGIGVESGVEESGWHQFGGSAWTTKEDGSGRSVYNETTSSASTRRAHAALDRAAWAQSTGFLLMGASCGDDWAWYGLGSRRAEKMSGVSHSTLGAASALFRAARRASEDFRIVGEEPLHERHRLTSDTVDKVEVAQGGEDDEHLRAQAARAANGDANAMLAQGDLYYWGARGLPRDQVRAREYFEDAAAAGHPGGMAALAGMMIRGEGGEQDFARAKELYEAAMVYNNTRAINGLAYLYFNGQGGVEMNRTRALELFLLAADGDGSGDAMYNAAVMIRDGLADKPPDPVRARKLLARASRETANFGAVYDLGCMLLFGKGGQWELEGAVQTLGHAARVAGPWGKLFRRAFDRYRHRDYVGATLDYLHTASQGLELGAADAAYLLDRGLSTPHSLAAPSSPNTHPFVLAVIASTQSRGSLPPASLLLARALLHSPLQQSAPFSLPAPTSIPPSASALALSLYEFSLSHGGVSSTRPLAALLERGSAGTTDVTKAVALFSKAAGAGDAASAFALGTLYERGRGPLAKSEARAIRYYQRCLELTKSDSEGGDATAAAVYLALGRLHLFRLLRRWGMAHVARWIDERGPALAQRMAKWAFNPRAETEQAPGQGGGEETEESNLGPIPAFFASSSIQNEADAVPHDAGTAVGSYRGQAASLTWVVGEILSNISTLTFTDAEVLLAAVLLFFILSFLAVQALIRSCCGTREDDGTL